MRVMSELTIHLLGQFHVRINGMAITNFASDKVRALLAYLSIENQYPHRREKLANLFWPDKADTTARGNLRRALSDLRAAIQDANADPPFLFVTRQDIQLNIDSQIEIDCLLLDQHVSQGCTNQNDVISYTKILSLYQGEFLEGFSLTGCADFYEWLLIVREKYHRKTNFLLEQIIQYYLSKDQFNQALPYCRQLVNLTPWHEEPRRLLMKILALTGNRDEALRQYKELAALLAQELNLEPETSTIQLMEDIRADVFHPPQSTPKTIRKPELPDFLKKKIDPNTKRFKAFVGREEALTALHTKLSNIIHTQNGSFHFITGEAGIGKTWLGREFITQAQEKYPNLVAAAGFCNAFTGIGDPYLPFREILSQLCGEIGVQVKAHNITQEYAIRLWESSRSTVQLLMKYGPGLVDTIVPGYVLLNEQIFHDFLDQQWYLDLRALVLKRQRTTDKIQFPALFSQLTKVFEKIAQRTPLILAIDDLQWADTGTLNLLMHLGKNLAGCPILILGAFRDGAVYSSRDEEPHPLQPVLNELQREFGGIYTKIDEYSGKDFVQSFLDRIPNALTPDFTDYLYQITKGHALFVSELFRTFQEKGLVKKNQQGQWIETGERMIQQLPPKVEGIIAQRIQTLPHQTQQFLSIASVEGEVFHPEIIAQVTKQPEEKIVEKLTPLVTGILHLSQPQFSHHTLAYPLLEYRFRHILYQKYLYDRIDVEERQHLHNYIGSILEAITKDHAEEYAMQLARHFHQAKQSEKAISYYLIAAKRAKKMMGYKEAIYLYEKALTLVEQQPASKQKNQQELMLRMQIGTAYQLILGFGHHKVDEAYQRAWELCQTLEADEHLLNILMILTSYASYTGDYQRYFEMDEQCKKIYSEINIDPFFRQLRRGWSNGFIDMRFGRFISSAENFQLAAEAYTKVQDSGSEATGMEAGIFCNGWAAINLCYIGKFQQVYEHITSIRKIMKHTTDKNYLASGFWFLGWIYTTLHEVEQAESNIESLLKISVEEYYLFYEAVGREIKGMILIYQQEFGKAIDELETSLKQVLMTGAVASVDEFYLLLADAYQKHGEIANAKEAVSTAEEYQKKTGETTNLSQTARLKGDIFLIEGEAKQAEEEYLAAIRIAQEQSAKLFELQAIEELCKLWHQQGKTGQARQRLSEILEKFNGQPEVGVLKEAKGLLKTLKRDAIPQQ